MPRRKNSKARSSADATMKKLKYVKYAPKSVAPVDAASASRRAADIVRPASCGCNAGRIAARSRLAAAAASEPECTSNRTDVAAPYLVFHNSRPRSNSMNAFGVVRYCFQYASSWGRTRDRSTGKGGSQSDRLLAAVIPGYSGARRLSAANPSIGTIRVSRNAAAWVVNPADASQRKYSSVISSPGTAWSSCAAQSLRTIESPC